MPERTPPARPLLTFALVAFNQEQYVRDAVLAAFSQDYQPLEIILSDDCSSDRTFDIMQELAANYAGPHRIVLNRNPSNLGLIAHVNQINSLATGELVVAAAGDDISLAHRVSRHAEVFEQHRGRVLSIHSAVTKIDEKGNELGEWKPPILATGSAPEEMALRFALIIGATHSWSREVTKTFGPIALRNTYEDLIIGFRSALLGQVVYIDEPLVRYRFGGGLSTRKTTAGSVHAKLQQGLKKIELRLAVLQQRRLDCLRADRADLAERLRRHIRVLAVKRTLCRAALPLAKMGRNRTDAAPR